MRGRRERRARAQTAGSVEAAGSHRDYDEVLIAVGHQDTSATALATDWTHAAPLVPAVFPVDRRLTRDRVPPGATVAIRGFALTFIDAALALTEGRGGSFEPLDHPYRLRYVPGADDAARILPFTRTGRPMLAKPGAALAAGTPGAGAHRGRGPRPADGLGGPLDLHASCCRSSPRRPASRSAAAIGSAPDVREPRSPSAAQLAEAAGGVADAVRLDPVEAIERSLAVGAGLVTPDRAWALGHAWRALYPAIVSQLSGDGLAARDWPAFLRLAAEMERIAFGPPPVNAAKLLALVDAGRVDLTHLRGGAIVSRDGRTLLQSERGSEPIDVVVDAVLPGPGAVGHGGLLADLVARGHARVAPGRRGLDVDCGRHCRDRDGALSAGLSAIGRPTEDSVIGNDTLSRTLHPHADRWAASVVRRCRERRRATGGIRERAGGAGMSVRAGCEGIVRVAGTPGALAGGALRTARAARRVDRELRLAAQRHRSGTARAQRGASCRTSRPTARSRLQDLLRPQGQQGARPRRRGRPTSGSGSTSPASASCGRCSTAAFRPRTSS